MESIAEWWNELDDLSRMTLRDGGTIVTALILAVGAGALVRRFLVGKGADKYLRFPWTVEEFSKAKEARGEKPTVEPATMTRIAAWFCGVSILLGGVWLLTRNHDAVEQADAIQTILVRIWEIALVVFPILLISGWLSRTLYELMLSPWLKSEMETLFPGKASGGGSFAETIAKALCVVIYGAFFLLIPVAIAAVFNISALEGLVVPAWHVVARLLTALVVFAVGYLGVAWARAQAERSGGDRASNAEVSDQISLGLVVFTVILALGLLVGVSGFAGGLVVIVLLGFLLWPVRHYIRDLIAGMLLRMQRVQQVRLDGLATEVKTVSPLLTHMEQSGTELTRRNWDVLNAAMQGSEPGASTAIAEESRDISP